MTAPATLARPNPRVANKRGQVHYVHSQISYVSLLLYLVNILLYLVNKVVKYPISPPLHSFNVRCRSVTAWASAPGTLLHWLGHQISRSRNSLTQRMNPSVSYLKERKTAILSHTIPTCTIDQPWLRCSRCPPSAPHRLCGQPGLPKQVLPQCS